MSARLRCAALVVAALAATACGKKGPPLPPFVRIPAAVETIAAARLGNDVHVTLTVPATNIDASVPIDIGRVDVYAYTGRAAPPRAQWAALGTVVASIPVAPPRLDERGVPLPQIEPSPDGALPGGAVTVIDTLDASAFEPGPLPPVDPRFAAVALSGAEQSPAPLRRFYLAIPFSRRGQPGPPGVQTELLLTPVPDPPAGVRVSYLPDAVTLTWEPSGGLLGFLLDRPLPPEPVPFDLPALAVGPAASAPDAVLPPGPTTYNVYRETAPDPLLLPAPAAPLWQTASPAPLNTSPLAGTSLVDEAADFGRLRCYTVRAQRGSAQSAPSAPACVTPMDVFPPAAPAGLAAVPSEGGISLIWEPNADVDLGGYLVLRREAGDATLRQLTPAPIAEARYRDADVTPGTRYVYAIVAVDSQVPLPNVSALSAPVEEVAR